MNKNKKSLLIVGNGMATGRLLDELIKRDHSEFEITVLGDEIHGCYNRIMLSPVLAGEMTASSIVNKPIDWYHQAGIHFVGGARVAEIHRELKQVVTEDGRVYPYDELVLAVGSRPATIAAKNQHLGNIYSFRTLDDVERITASASEASNRALVVGGGLLGLEAAYGLAQKGLKVTVVHRGGWLLNRQLDKQAGLLLKQLMKQKGIDFQLSAEVLSFDGDANVCCAQLSNGVTVPCQLVVIATGITPNKELGIDAGLNGVRGIDVDATMRTSDPYISAIGECIEFNGITFGLVEPIWQHCVTLADRLALRKCTPFTHSSVATKLKVSGVQLFSAGDYLTRADHRELIYADLSVNIYRKLLLKNNRIVGIVLFGDTRDGQDYFHMLQTQQSVAAIAPLLLLGKAFYQAEHDAVAA